MGPRSRDVLAAITARRRVERRLPFRPCRRIAIAGAPVLALRITYVGELGWELHIPVEFAAVVFDALMEAGGRTASSMPAIGPSKSLRLEKFYRAWGSDIGPDHSP